MRGASIGVALSAWGPVLAAAGFMCLAACGAGEEPSNGPHRTTAVSTGAGTGDSRGGGGSGGTTVGVSGGGSIIAGTGGSGTGGGIITPPPMKDAGPDPDAACTGEVREGERLPLDMYFLLDQSGSMTENVQGGAKWKVVTDALVTFLNDPANADIGAGIGYFPLQAGFCMSGDPGCSCIPIINFCFNTKGGSCMAPDYAAPSIPLSLPPNHAPVVADIAKHSPNGGTPTRPALEGAMQYVTSWASMNANRKTVVVLATDGDPEGCTQNTPQDVANVAAGALASAHPVQTFVIGVGSSLTSLNLVAQAGGTGMAFLVDTGGNVGASFAAALSQIRGQAAPCDFMIPQLTSQGPVDPNLVNVFVTPKGATQPVAVPKTQGGAAANCTASGGWYYEDPSAPKAIKLCDATCQSLQGGKVELEFGCKTIVSVN
jgi:hypothetical protein